MRRETVFPTCCALMMLIGGCPKRQAAPRLVFTTPPPAPAAAPVTAANNAPSQIMVIEEPEPQVEEPEQVPAPETAHANKREGKPRRVTKPGPPPTTPEPPDTDEDVPETPDQPPSAAVPALEPRESSAQVSVLRQQVQSLQDDVRTRLSRINESKLSQDDRRTLDDARAFFSQSNHALEQGDLQRALLLAKKASALVTALEQ